MEYKIFHIRKVLPRFIIGLIKSSNFSFHVKNEIMFSLERDLNLMVFILF